MSYKKNQECFTLNTAAPSKTGRLRREQGGMQGFEGRCVWMVMIEGEMNDYDHFSKCFVDKIELCIANIMGTFLQSFILLALFIPYQVKLIVCLYC